MFTNFFEYFTKNCNFIVLILRQHSDAFKNNSYEIKGVETLKNQVNGRTVQSHV